MILTVAPKAPGRASSILTDANREVTLQGSFDACRAGDLPISTCLSATARGGGGGGRGRRRGGGSAGAGDRLLQPVSMLQLRITSHF